MFLGCFNVLVLKINFLKNYFDVFSNEKHFKKQSLPLSQNSLILKFNLWIK